MVKGSPEDTVLVMSGSNRPSLSRVMILDLPASVAPTKATEYAHDECDLLPDEEVRAVVTGTAEASLASPPPRLAVWWLGRLFA